MPINFLRRRVLRPLYKSVLLKFVRDQILEEIRPDREKLTEVEIQFGEVQKNANWATRVASEAQARTSQALIDAIAEEVLKKLKDRLG